MGPELFRNGLLVKSLKNKDNFEQPAVETLDQT
jgi:hypothetical protein